MINNKSRQRLSYQLILILFFKGLIKKKHKNFDRYSWFKYQLIIDWYFIVQSKSFIHPHRLICIDNLNISLKISKLLEQIFQKRKNIEKQTIRNSLFSACIFRIFPSLILWRHSLKILIRVSSFTKITYLFVSNRLELSIRCNRLQRI